MSRHPIAFDIQAGQQNISWDDWLALARRAEEWGYDGFWAFDHLYPIFSDPDGPCFEGWTSLAAVAQATSRIRIGHMVNGNTYRHPSLVAKMATTVDHMSHGRLNLGIGAGWFELEHTSLGFDFKTVRGRLEALEESCRILKGMLGGERVTLAGKHYKVEEARCVPAPVQDGGPPLMIGGSGRKILLRIVARYADAWNATGTPQAMGELVDVIRRHGDDVGRDTEEIEKSVMMTMVYTPDTDRQEAMVGMMAATFGMDAAEARAGMMVGGKDECLERIAAYQEVGVTRFLFMSFAPYNTDEMQAFMEEVAPAARG
jgi:F420-dependent oxidoreductase-like protein